MLPGSKAGWMEYEAGNEGLGKTVKCPQGMVIFDVPGEHHGALASLRATCEGIMARWKTSVRQQAGDYDMEVYGEKFLDFIPDSVFYIYEPLK